MVTLHSGQYVSDPNCYSVCDVPDLLVSVSSVDMKIQSSNTSKYLEWCLADGQYYINAFYSKIE